MARGCDARVPYLTTALDSENACSYDALLPASAAHHRAKAPQAVYPGLETKKLQIAAFIVHSEGAQVASCRKQPGWAAAAQKETLELRTGSASPKMQKCRMQCEMQKLQTGCCLTLEWPESLFFLVVDRQGSFLILFWWTRKLDKLSKQTRQT